MVTNNIETDLDITNGAQGEIVDIILHPDEPPLDPEQSIIYLKYLPVFLLVKLTHTKATQLARLEDHVIPIVPMSVSYRVKMSSKEGDGRQRTIRRTQFPITPLYAITDYRSQAQTLPIIIVDIAPPPTGTLNLFNLYVALSRSHGRQSIRLLQDFDDKMFQKGHEAQLLQEDKRLENLDETTLTWYKMTIKLPQNESTGKVDEN